MENFERWLNSSKVDLEENIFELFSDSLKCYKNEIFRPAYLLAYQGMMMHIKHVILSGKKPDSISQGEWADILSKLNDERSWDEEAFKRVQQSGANTQGKEVIRMSDEARKTFENWRFLRNVCAHYKSYKFIPAHTLTLYSFISQYLLQMTIPGGSSSLLDEFETYLNPSFTPASADALPLVEKVSKMVPENEMTSFLTGLLQLIHRFNTHSSNEIFKLLLESSARESIVNFLRLEGNGELRNQLIDFHPPFVHFLLISKPETIRKFWKNELQYLRSKFSILAELIIAGKIKEEEIEKAIIVLMKYEYEHCTYALGYSDNADYDVLRKSGYEKIFISNYLNKEFMRNNLQAVCFRTPFYFDFFEKNGLTEDVIKSLIDIFNQAKYPYILHDRIKDEILNPGFGNREKFEEVCTKFGLKFPASLK